MNAYLAAALDHARTAILTAGAGSQEWTLHREAYSIGGLIGEDLSEGEAFAALLSAAKAMTAYGEPWRNLERKVKHSLARGMETPRRVPRRAASARASSSPAAERSRISIAAGLPASPSHADGRPRALWRKAPSQIDDDGPADLYLRGRGFKPPYPATLRYLPGRGDHPHALIAALGLPDEPEPGLLAIPDAAVRAVHLTRLDATGTKRLKTDDAKIVVGRAGLGFPVVVTPINDGLGLLIAEGIENALSLGRSLGLGAWAACSHTRMPALADTVPGYVEFVTIVADPEPAARASACALAKRLERRGFEVRVKVMGDVA
jgi:hypothetical protein